MSDYGPKSIPILDDIIKDESTNANETGKEIDSDDYTLDLFNQATTNTEAGTFESTDKNSTSAESALIHYQTEDDHAADHPATTEQPPQQNSVEASLDLVVENVINQLMPDLEQQLRFFIKQALEDKLPKDIIQKISGKNEKTTP